MIKVAKNLNIELDIADLMKQFESGPVLPTTSLLLPFHESHAMLLKLRKPITVSDFHDPNENTYPPDWYVSDRSEDDHLTEYFIQPMDHPLAHRSTMTPLLTISGVPQSSSYLTRLRFAALRTIKQHLPSKHKHALVACYHNISRHNSPVETVLVIYLPSSFHTVAQ
jgi:hypothetical protein